MEVRLKFEATKLRTWLQKRIESIEARNFNAAQFSMPSRHILGAHAFPMTLCSFIMHDAIRANAVCLGREYLMSSRDFCDENKEFG